MTMNEILGILALLLVVVWWGLACFKGCRDIVRSVRVKSWKLIIKNSLLLIFLVYTIISFFYLLIDFGMLEI